VSDNRPLLDFPTLIPGFVSLANAALAALVLVNRPRAYVNRLFALTALSAAAWAGTNALFQWTDSPDFALSVAQASSVSALLMGASFLHFAWVYPVSAAHLQGTNSIHRRRLYLLWLSAGLLCLLSLWPGGVDRAVEMAPVRRLHTAPGFYLVALFLCLASMAAFSSFVRRTLSLHGTLRQQALWVLSGTGLTAIFGIVFNLLFPLWGDYRFVWVGPSCSLFFVGATVYSIIAHHLFDVRLVVKKAAVYSLLLALLSAGYSAVQYLATRLLESAAPGASDSLAAHVMGAVLVSLFVKPVREWLEKRIHRLLYPRRSPQGSQEQQKQRA
jgi:hypothetical protein